MGWLDGLFPTVLGEAVIGVLPPADARTVSVRFDVNRLKLAKNNEFAEPNIPGLNGGPLQFVRGRSRTLSAVLAFDGRATNTDVRQLMKPVDGIDERGRTHAYAAGAVVRVEEPVFSVRPGKRGGRVPLGLFGWSPLARTNARRAQRAPNLGRIGAGSRKGIVHRFGVGRSAGATGTSPCSARSWRWAPACTSRPSTSRASRSWARWARWPRSRSRPPSSSRGCTGCTRSSPARATPSTSCSWPARRRCWSRRVLLAAAGASVAWCPAGARAHPVGHRGRLRARGHRHDEAVLAEL